MSILAVAGLIAWGVVVYLRRSQTLSVKSIENTSGDLHVIHLTNPDNMTWKAGSYVKITLPSSVSGSTKFYNNKHLRHSTK